MGFFKKVFRPVRKIAKKIIPKEVRPFLPYVAAAFGPATAGLTGTAFAKAAAQKALIAAATSAATDEQGDPLRAGLLSITPDLIGAGTEKLAGGDGRIAEFLNKTKTLKDGTETVSLAETISSAASPETFMGQAKLLGTQTAVDQAAKFAEINQDEIDRYNEELRRQGVLDKTKRRSAIFNIYKNAGYDDDYVNSMLDRYGYDEGGIVEALRKLKAKMRAPETVAKMSDRLKRKPKDDKTMIPPKKPKDPENEEEPVEVSVVKEKPDFVEAMLAAKSGVEQAFGIPFGGVAPAEFKRFARGGEVEIEEETDDLGIMDFMKDQGIEYGEMASHEGNTQLLEQLYEDFLDLGYSPEDAAKKAREAFDNMSKKPDQGIMQMASGYKTDIEEMYEQYVFEMEEQGLQPMSFAEFVRQARAGMADGGKVKRRKNDDPEDEIIETEEEIFIDKMPKPRRRQGIMEAADGGIMEKDMRGGGFIPEGTKERADDVPARLSTNEFVMTADAVRAAGGGSVNKGAKRMYDMMYQLEGKV